MKGSLKKRVLSGLLAFCMVTSPAGAGISTIPAFADNVSAVNTDGTDEGESSKATPDDGENTSDEGDANPDEGDTNPDEGEADPNEGDNTQDMGEGDAEEQDETSDENESIDDSKMFISPDAIAVDAESGQPIFEKYGDDVLPIYGVFYDLDANLKDHDHLVFDSVNSYVPEKYASTNGYDGLTTAEKKIYDAIYTRAVEIQENTEDYKFLGKIYYSDGKGGAIPKDVYYFFNKKDASGIISIESATYRNVDRAYTALTYDNPQLFWLAHTFYYDESSSNAITSIAIGTEVKDYATGSKRNNAKNALYKEVEAVLEGADVFANDYSKEWYVHDYICNKTIYDPDLGKSSENPKDHDVTGLFLDEVCVCESYAKSTQLLLNALDVDVLYVVGYTSPTGGGHAWNQVGLDGKWYNYDATWDDNKPSDWDRYGYYSYDWFNVTDDDFTGYHYAFPSSSSYVKVYSTNTCTSTTYAYENHDSNFMISGYDFVVTGDGRIKGANSFDDAVKYINDKNSNSTDYTITYYGNAPEGVTVSSNVNITAAKSVTITGGTYTFNGSFTSSSDVILEGEINFNGSVTVSKTVTVKGIVTTGKASTVKISDVVYAGSSESDSLIICGTAEIKNITANEYSILGIGENSDISITGKVSRSSDNIKVNVIPYDADGKSVKLVENGTVVFKSSSVDVSFFKSKFSIQSEQGTQLYEFVVYKEGNEIKLSMPTIMVFDAGYYNEEVEEVQSHIGSFFKFEDAVKAVNANKSLVGHEIVFMICDDLVASKLTLPSKAGKVVIKGYQTSEKYPVLTVKSASASVNLELDNIYLETATLTASKNLIIGPGFDSNSLVTIKGGSKSKLTYRKTGKIPANITGFGTMVLCADITPNVTLNVGTLDIGSHMVKVDETTTNFTVKEMIGAYGQIQFQNTNVKPIKITGKTYGNIELYIMYDLAAGQKLFETKTADMSVFILFDKSGNNSQEHGFALTQDGKNLSVGKSGFSVIWDDTEDAGSAYLSEWADVVSVINIKNNPKNIYIVEVLNNYSMSGALTMPKAKTFAELDVDGDGNSISFVGTSIKLTGHTQFEDIVLISNKKNSEESVSFNIAAGKCNLGIQNVTAKISGITSSGDVYISNSSILGNVSANNFIVDEAYSVSELAESTNAWSPSAVAESNVTVGGNLTVKNMLDIESSLKVKGALTTAGITANNDDSAMLTVYSGKKIAFGKLGFDANGGKLKFALLGSDDKTVQIQKEIVISSISGPYADQLVPVTENYDAADDEAGYIIIKSKDGKSLIAQPKTETLEKSVKVLVGSSEKPSYYGSFEEAVKDISATGNPKYTYKFVFTEDMYFDKLPIPSANKFSELFFTTEGDTKVTITTASDLAFTGTLWITNNVTVNKVDKNNKDKILPISVNASNANSYLICNGKLSYYDDANHIMNISGKGKFNTIRATVIDGKVSIGTYYALDKTIFNNANSTFTVDTLFAGGGSIEYPSAMASKIKIGSVFKSGGLKIKFTDKAITDKLPLAAITGDFEKDSISVNETGLAVVRSGKNLIAVKSDTVITAIRKNSDHTYTYRAYDSYASAVADITRIGDPKSSYTINLPAGSHTFGKLALPAAKKYGSLTIDSEEGKAVITLTSDIALTGDLNIGSNITMKKLSGALGINIGTYYFDCSGKISPTSDETNQLSKVSGKGTIRMNNGDVEVKNSMNVGTFIFPNEGGDLRINMGATFIGSVHSNSNSTMTYYASKVKFNDISVSEGNTLTLWPLYVRTVGSVFAKNGDTIATITGDCTDRVKVHGDSSNLVAARKANKLIAVRLVNVYTADQYYISDGGEKIVTATRNYVDYLSIFSDISRIKNPSNCYEVKLHGGYYYPPVLPPAGKYDTIEFSAPSSAALFTTKDITLTGNLVIGKNVILARINNEKDMDVVPLKITTPKGKNYTVSVKDGGAILNASINGSGYTDYTSDAPNSANTNTSTDANAGTESINGLLKYKDDFETAA